MHPGNFGEQRCEPAVRRRVARGQVNGRLTKLAQPVIAAGIDLQHVEPPFEQLDRRQKARALQAVATGAPTLKDSGSLDRNRLPAWSR